MHRPPVKRKNGFSALELMVAIGVTAFSGALLTKAVMDWSRSQLRINDQSELEAVRVSFRQNLDCRKSIDQAKATCGTSAEAVIPLKEIFGRDLVPGTPTKYSPSYQVRGLCGTKVGEETLRIEYADADASTPRWQNLFPNVPIMCLSPIPLSCIVTSNVPSVTVGQPVTLTLGAAGNALSGAINGVAVSVPSGSRNITPSSSGNLIVNGTVSGPGGTATCQTTVNVQSLPPPPAPTCTLTASSNSVTVGSPVTFILATSGSVTAASIGGTAVSFPSGTRTVVTTTVGTLAMSATVTGPGGNGSCSRSVTVAPVPPPAAPTCTLVASPNNVATGAIVNLLMSTSGVVSSASIGGVAVAYPSGSRSITTSAAGTFTAVGNVSGPGGSSTCQTTYTATNPAVAPTCTLAASSPSVTVGSPLTLTLTTTGNATSSTIDGVSVPRPTGSRVINTTVTGNFTATGIVSGPGGSTSCTRPYSVTAPNLPPTCTLVATPANITLGQSLTLSFGPSSGTITSATIQSVSVPFPGGTRVITPTAAGNNLSASATVSGPGGSANCSVLYNVAPPPTPPGCSLTANPMRIVLGQSLTLALSVTSGVATSGTIGGVSTSIPTGSRVIVPTAPGTFTTQGTVTGAGGTGLCQTLPYVVDPPPPPRPTCTLSVDPPPIRTLRVHPTNTAHNTPVTIRISATDATSGTIDGIAVTVPTGSRTYTPYVGGNFVANGFVSGPGGTATCQVTYFICTIRKAVAHPTQVGTIPFLGYNYTIYRYTTTIQHLRNVFPGLHLIVVVGKGINVHVGRAILTYSGVTLRYTNPIPGLDALIAFQPDTGAWRYDECDGQGSCLPPSKGSGTATSWDTLPGSTSVTFEEWTMNIKFPIDFYYCN